MIKNVFKLDLRSLSLARVLLGLLVFFDLWRRIEDLDTFFTDSGILSRADLLRDFELSWRMSLLNLNGSYEFALILLILGILSALTFILGWKTRFSNLIVWLVTISFQTRFPEAATSGGDMLIRIFLFYSIFLPMGACYSIDHAVSEIRFKDREYMSVFSALWVVQIFLLYFFTFWYKWSPVYHTTYEAVWYMLQLDIFTTDIGKWMGQQYHLTRILSFLAYALELIGPLMLLIPWKRDSFRGVAVVAFWSFHLGIALTLHLGNFVPICLIIWAGMIPTSWWDLVSEKLNQYNKQTLTLYYECKTDLSKQLALIVKEMFFIENLHTVPASSAISDMMNEQDRFVLRDQDDNLSKGFIVLPKVLQASQLAVVRYLGKILGSDLSLYLNEVQEVGSFRPEASHHTSFRFFSALESIFATFGFGRVKYQLNRAEKALGAFLLALIIGWNIEGFVKEREWYIGSPFDEVMFTLQLNQGWAMFAPHPQRSDGWWVMEGELKSGKSWDALNNKEVSFDRPENIYETYASEDWRKFLDNLQATRDEKYLLALGRFLCRKWNAEHRGAEALQTFKLHFMQEWTNPPHERVADVKKITLWNHSCF